MCLYECVHICTFGYSRAEEVIRSPGARVRDSWELPGVFMIHQQVLTREPSLQPPKSFHCLSDLACYRQAESIGTCLFSASDWHLLLMNRL